MAGQQQREAQLGGGGWSLVLGADGAVRLELHMALVVEDGGEPVTGAGTAWLEFPAGDPVGRELRERTLRVRAGVADAVAELTEPGTVARAR